jgi:plasmid stabilization system protein ParE
MNATYEIVIGLPVRQNIYEIADNIVDYSNQEDANNWEDGLSEVIASLKTTPNHQECPKETKGAKASIRKILYRQKGVRRNYHLYYRLETYPTPDPEPNYPYPAGRVTVLFVRHASQKELTTAEIQARIKASDNDIADVDNLTKKLKGQ